MDQLPLPPFSTCTTLSSWPGQSTTCGTRSTQSCPGCRKLSKPFTVKTTRKLFFLHENPLKLWFWNLKSAVNGLQIAVYQTVKNATEHVFEMIRTILMARRHYQTGPVRRKSSGSKFFVTLPKPSIFHIDFSPEIIPVDFPTSDSRSKMSKPVPRVKCVMHQKSRVMYMAIWIAPLDWISSRLQLILGTKFFE